MEVEDELNHHAEDHREYRQRRSEGIALSKRKANQHNRDDECRAAEDGLVVA